MWHWKTFFLLWRVLCFKIRYRNSWKPCNLLASKPHLHHTVNVQKWGVLSGILWKCSCGHTLKMCSSSQVQQAWRSKLTHQATFAETKTCATLCFYNSAVQFGSANTTKCSTTKFLYCYFVHKKTWESFWCAKILERCYRTYYLIVIMNPPKHIYRNRHLYN